MKDKTQQQPRQPRTNLDITKFQLLHDSVLVKAIEVGGVKGLVNPDQYEDKPEYGEIVLIGTEVEILKKGQIVKFGQYSTEKIRSNGEDYYLIHFEDIQGYLPN